MKNVLKAFGVIAFVAIIGFSMAGCKNDDDGGGLPAPSLTASPSGTVTAGTTIYLDWTSIAGASRYNFYLRYLSEGQWVSKSMSSTSATFNSDRDDAGETVQIKVAAVNSNGAEGAHSNVVSVTFTGGSTQPQPNTSINGTWEYTSSSSTGGGGGNPTPGIQHSQITVSGNTGRLTRRSYSPLEQDAINKGYYDINSIMWRNITSTGNLKWSGQTLAVLHRTSTPDIAGAAQWYNCTITMSANGKTITIVTPWSYENSSGTLTETWTRQ